LLSFATAHLEATTRQPLHANSPPKERLKARFYYDDLRLREVTQSGMLLSGATR